MEAGGGVIAVLNGQLYRGTSALMTLLHPANECPGTELAAACKVGNLCPRTFTTALPRPLVLQQHPLMDLGTGSSPAPPHQSSVLLWLLSDSLVPPGG